MKIKTARYLLISLCCVLLLSLIGILTVPSLPLQRILSTVALIATFLVVIAGLYYWTSTIRTLEAITEHAKRIIKEDFSSRPSTSSTPFSAPEDQLKEVIENLEGKIRTLGTERDHLHAVLQGMMEGLVVTDSETEILLANPSFYGMFALDNRCEGKTVLESLRNNEIHDTLLQALQRQTPYEKEVVIRKQGQEKNLLVHINPLLNPSGLRGAVLVFFDVTPIRKLENSRKEFVANVSHELKTPLTAIRGFAETLLESALKDPAIAKRFLEKIENNARQLQNLIEDLLRLSEIESGRVEFKPAAISLQKAFQQMHEEFSEALKKKRLYLSIELKEDIHVYAEPSALKQILVNLVENAIKYTPEGGRITLDAQREKAHAKILVTDTGMGIPEGDLPHIFERFYRVDKARSRELEGTGLGLAIVKHLVQTQGGETGVQSKVKQGSRFFFTLPLFREYVG
jgi:two-component system phosphate regulon sensor histidine kinase PhoR